MYAEDMPYIPTYMVKVAILLSEHMKFKASHVTKKKGGERFCKDKRTHSNLNALHVIGKFQKTQRKSNRTKKKKTNS